MALQFGLLVPQGWTMDLAQMKNPVEAYETMTRVAQTAEEVGFASDGTNLEMLRRFAEEFFSGNVA